MDYFKNTPKPTATELGLIGLGMTGTNLLESLADSKEAYRRQIHRRAFLASISGGYQSGKVKNRTADELASADGADPLQDQVHKGPLRYNGIGRNSPCPCGSGKKLKHCCIDQLR